MSDEDERLDDALDHITKIEAQLATSRTALERIGATEVRGNRTVCVRCNLTVEHCDANFIPGNDGCMARLARRALAVLDQPPGPTVVTQQDVLEDQPPVTPNTCCYGFNGVHAEDCPALPTDPVEAVLAVECKPCTVAIGQPCYRWRDRGDTFCASRIRAALGKPR